MLPSLLRWAGGKARYARSIAGYLPATAEIDVYFEPFLGAASVFLAYRPSKAILSDANEQLIRTFNWVKRRPDLVRRYLNDLERNDSRRFYGDVRDTYNRGGNGAAQAARFVYLNRASFNGIFRVNREGKYNVPYGSRDDLAIPNASDFSELSEALRNAALKTCDYTAALRTAGNQDVVYLDPPYPPLNGTSFFTHYTKERFSKDDQVALSETAHDLVRRGCFVLMTNADVTDTRRLYKGWHRSNFMRTRWVSSGNKKHKVAEVILVGYNRKKWPNVDLSALPARRTARTSAC